MPALYALLARLSPNVLRTVATRIGGRLGWATIPTTAQTLVASIRGAVVKNPRAARIVIESLKFGGLTLAADQVMGLFSDDNESTPAAKAAIMDEVTSAAAEYFAAAAENRNNANRIGGDGDPSKAHGEDIEDYLADKEAFVGRIARIRDLAQRNGGFQALLEIREIVALEEADIMLAQQFNATRGLRR